ncbi:hypothetical protein [Hyphomicrobium sp. LHD-15]|jgi:hypothetical protein|uniref:hypothetical protein n=1 Tax=Hyphomicrobium sp. LHD-15 TaxID=3072142 RepID=UPI00280D3D23|nr:hypothetical protein [Hyphomicrobium sp. LHD-15]MDQ8698539.1 hypothetical protein [Hyphomicrobium sp. LHD-15]
MKGTSVKTLVLGIIAGAIAVVTVHELIVLWLNNSGLTTRIPWSMEPSAYSGLPQIAVDAAWGGLWGAIFAIILGGVPEGSMTVRGAILGLFGPAILGGLLIVPLLNGQQPFYGNDIEQIRQIALPAIGFGAVTAWLYGFLTSGCRLP